MGKPATDSLHNRLQKVEQRQTEALARLSRIEGRQRAILGFLLELLRWVYAWIKKQNYTKRLEDLKANGESVKALLDDSDTEDAINF